LAAYRSRPRQFAAVVTRTVLPPNIATGLQTVPVKRSFCTDHQTSALRCQRPGGTVISGIHRGLPVAEWAVADFLTLRQHGMPADLRKQ
jgi:hypothetical protein